MNFNEYQKKCDRTAIYPNKHTIAGLIYATLGLAGEAGEFANKVKKILRDDNSLITDIAHAKLIDELGDVLWYVAAATSELSSALESVALRNTIKLERRLVDNTLGGSGDER